MSARLMQIRASPLLSRFQSRRFAQALDVNTQPKVTPATPAYEFDTPEFSWVPKSFQTPAARPDPSKLFADIPVVQYPLPVYTTELSAERAAEFAADTLPVEQSEPSPLAKYGVLPVGFFGMTALAAHEVFLLNEESLLVGTWTCFLLTCYVQMGDMVRQTFASKALSLKDAHVNGINQQLAAVDKLAATLQARVKSAEEAKQMQAAFASLLERVKAMAVHKQRRLLAQTVLERLHEVRAIEEKGARTAVEAVVKRVNDTVVSVFSASPELRKAILKESIDALAATKDNKTKVNNAVISSVYQLALENTRYSMERLRIGDVALNKKLLLDGALKEKLVTDVAGAVRRAWGSAASGDEGVASRKQVNFTLPSYTRVAA